MRWLMPVSPLIHPPGLISASALENDPTPQDYFRGMKGIAWKIRWVWSWKTEGFLFLLSTLLLHWRFWRSFAPMPLPFSAYPTPQPPKPPTTEQVFGAFHLRAAMVRSLDRTHPWSQEVKWQDGQNRSPVQLATPGAPGFVTHPLETSCIACRDGGIGRGVSWWNADSVTVCEMTLPLKKMDGG